MAAVVESATIASKQILISIKNAELFPFNQEEMDGIWLFRRCLNRQLVQLIVVIR